MTLVLDPTPVALLATFLTALAVALAVTAVLITRDMWRERWNGNIRGHDYETDIDAFLGNFVDDTVPRLAWGRVIAVPVGATGMFTGVFWTCYVLIAVVTRVIA
ncbi:hypothetical protein PN419_00090 [Halorubrum ezzemoulense]|uniref:hypothetical protein n=1 Tax=Halorubrum ezzemoulense TaxID=337243 RepID=UPI00232C3B78|nr:hypothetical protein [Halorubrum ezzemoulense]MDB9247406.1 hypothetical protein [Halorubrum ezzemoulense]MDB9258685.1 hypothetical protein [Halorubrum ezzemoulense]MDB9264457.1 hypothetical protein [Halorubrum ezzemoulense]MDB9269046.1 hypothetical protein [Halorubrum ezzemoulense]MDB9271425.1 hypothetical protein [Halorubrum ezzemoulense]